MDFPHVDEKTDERFTRLWPKHAENSELKVAAEANPKMLAFSREDGGPHFRLYESRIPSTVDADAAFGAFATAEAKSASLAESAEFRAGKQMGEKAEKATIDERYPEGSRYYPPLGKAADTAEGLKSEREGFNKTVAGLVAEGALQKGDVRYVAQAEAFVSKNGPVEALARWQSPEMKAQWLAEGKTQKEVDRQPASRAKEVVDASDLRAKGEHFLADHGQGLLLPSKKSETERAGVLAQLGKASIEDLKTVQGVSEREFKALERKQYAIQIKAAQEKNPDLTTEAFNAMKDPERRVAAGYNEIKEDEFKRMVALRSGFFAITDELKSRGEHMSREEARDLKNNVEKQSEAKPVDEKSTSRKPSGQGRAGSSKAAADALAASLGR